ncbi:hypothetical protein EJ08DRAFT_592756 [Tothia fuscella]|uniref:Uncharacterized protein n=1 Tax=Tothia fuscella TaxID=1048955 RepID=A0A9P4NM36_9PEZI|nr:hypothetical protein EJ08DRAFT_592756 [Tothia fuscella]
MNFPRDLIAFPGGSNATDTVINNIHFNTTALRYWNYTYYEGNRTISNNSKCYLIFENYQPRFLLNGTWLNATNCNAPILGIKTRGKLGITFGSIFAISIMFTLINLKKHGQQFLREDKRFRLVGRRWQWYWMLFVAGCGMISTITSVDVDRNYLQDLPIVLQSFFFILMVPGTMAIVWEAVRHWGSWQERQVVDLNPFSLPQDDRRGKTELYMPLLFYFIAWLNFFMDIPRSWGKLEKQHSIAQQRTIAEPAGTDVRFKAGGIIAALGIFVILWSLQHSMHHYQPHRKGIVPAITNFFQKCPPRLYLAIIILAIRLAYGIFMPWHWQTSIFKYDASPEWYYGAGYAPPALIIIIFNIWGFIDENEDKQLIAQRRMRGQLADDELGIVKRPHWWRKRDHAFNDEQRLRNLTTEVGGGRATAQRVSQNVELGNMNINRHSVISTATGGVARPESYPAGGSIVTGMRDRSRSRPRDDPFRDLSPTGSEVSGEGILARPGLVGRRSSGLSGWTDASGATGLTGQTLTGSRTSEGPPQRVRSMLDI